MTIEVKKENGTVVFSLDGRVDSATAGELEEAFAGGITEDIRAIVVDMKNVDFVSSKGLRILVGAYRNLDGGDFTIRNANDSVKEVLRLSGLFKVFKVE